MELLYDRRKQEIDTENKRRVNPSYQPPQMALPTGGRPMNKQQPGMAGQPQQAAEKGTPEYEKSSFFQVKKSLGDSNPDFNNGRDRIEQIASQLGEQVNKGHMPRRLAEKKLKMAIDDFANESKGNFGKRKAADKAMGLQKGKIMNNIQESGSVLKDKIIAAKGGDKDAQMELREANFDWMGPQADAAIQQYGQEEEEA